jgi:hypothetical protein
MSESPTRSAARLAALIAIPIALVCGVLAFFTLHHTLNAGATASPTPSASASADTSPVVVPAPALDATDKQMCLAFVAALPTKLRNLPERHVTAGAEQNAAFGTPPITAECGATESQVAQTADILVASDVCWYALQNAQATVLTTLDRTVPIAITVPNSYSGAGQWATEFRNAIISAVPSKPTPYNC